MVTILNGKFYKDGVVMPVEFGNKEQAEVFEKATQHEKALKEGLVLDSTIEVTFTAEFTCYCGKTIMLDGEGDSEDSIDVLAGRVLKCSCKKYRFKTYMDSGVLMVQEIR